MGRTIRSILISRDAWTVANLFSEIKEHHDSLSCFFFAAGFLSAAGAFADDFLAAGFFFAAGAFFGGTLVSLRKIS